MPGKVRLGNINDSNDLRILLNSLEIVKRKGKELWNPIDVINTIYNENAGFIIGKDDDCLTFYVKTEYSINICWIWTAYSKGTNVLEYYIDDIKELATKCNCSEIRWSSKRKGYAKRIPKVDGQIHQIEYKIQIGN